MHHAIPSTLVITHFRRDNRCRIIHLSAVACGLCPPCGECAIPTGRATRRAIFLGIRDAGAAATAYFSSLTEVPVPEALAPVPVPDDAQEFLTSQFVPINELYNATGNITFYRLIDDSVIMRFEQFSVTNAPDLALYLSANEAPTDINDIGGIVPEFPVGPLRGTVGDQQYTIPRELRIDRYRTM